MSNQRRTRSEARHGLNQYLMALYLSYKEEHSVENSKQFVVDVIKGELEYFSDGLPAKDDSVLNALAAIQSSITKKMKASSDEVERYELSEDMSSINRTIELIKAKEEGN